MQRSRPGLVRRPRRVRCRRGLHRLERLLAEGEDSLTRTSALRSMSEEFCLVNSIDRTSTRIRGSTQNQRRPPPETTEHFFTCRWNRPKTKQDPRRAGRTRGLPMAAVTTPESAEGPRTILVCDDAPEAALLVQASLERDSDYVIEFAADGAEALDKARALTLIWSYSTWAYQALTESMCVENSAPSPTRTC